jgi:hypothetical protein
MDELTFRIYKDDEQDSENKNETNFYEWEYNNNSSIKWRDASGYNIDYIKAEYCIKKGNICSFYIGIKDTLPNVVDYWENWTGDVYSNGNKIHSQGIVIEKLVTGISASEPSSIIFYVEPFTQMNVQGNDFFKIGNAGNIPLSIEIDYNRYNNVIELTNFNKNLFPGEINTHYITLHSQSWPPGIKEIKIEGVGSYPNSYFIDTNATVTLYSAFVIDIPLLKIYVGHSNYKINELPNTNITFQHLEKIDMYEGETRDIKVYVSGNGTVKLEIVADEENIRLLKLKEDNVEKTSPITFLSTNDSERIITARVEAISEGETGILDYELTTGGVTKTYTTQILIGPPISPDNEISISSDLIWRIGVIILVLIVVLYMLSSYVKHKRR